MAGRRDLPDLRPPVCGRSLARVIKVDVWSDVVCPWCYIGKRRFAEGVRRYQADGGTEPVQVEYHSFELAPDVPADYEGNAADFLASHKGLPADQVQQMLTHVGDLAAAEGLDYHWDDVQHTKTLKAHELLHLAKAHDLQEPMKERLLSAYFVEGRHVGDIDELADLGADVGLDRQQVIEALTAGTYAAAVQADIDQAHQYGISGVPFYVIDGKYGVSGAQAPQTFAEALTMAAGEQPG